MNPEQIKEGRSYLDYQNRRIDILKIEKIKNVQTVVFYRHKPDEARGRWKLKDLASILKEEVKP